MKITLLIFKQSFKHSYVNKTDTQIHSIWHKAQFLTIDFRLTILKTTLKASKTAWFSRKKNKAFRINCLSESKSQVNNKFEFDFGITVGIDSTGYE